MNKKCIIFDTFDSNGKLNGKKSMICKYQNIECEYQRFFGEGAFLTCGHLNSIKSKRCFKDVE